MKQKQEVHEIIPDNWEDELADLKWLNNQELSPSQTIENIPIEKPQLPQLILSDEQLLESYQYQMNFEN